MDRALQFAPNRRLDGGQWRFHAPGDSVWTVLEISFPPDCLGCHPLQHDGSKAAFAERLHLRTVCLGPTEVEESRGTGTRGVPCDRNLALIP